MPKAKWKNVATWHKKLWAMIGFNKTLKSYSKPHKTMIITDKLILETYNS